MKAAVIGGGISGLVTAYRLKKLGVDVTLYEADSRVGGIIGTDVRDGFVLEHGPNSLLASRPLLDLVEDLGLAGEVLMPRADGKTRFIVKDGRLTPLPSSVIGFITSRAFSTRAKIDVLKELFVGSKAASDESVSGFFERRFGKEITDFALDPFISGIYAGDPKRLSIKYAFPRIFHYERKHGSVIKGALLTRKPRSERLPKGFPRSFAFRRGMVMLIDALLTALGSAVRTGVHVDRVTRSGAQYVIELGGEFASFDAVVISTPADASSKILGEMNSELAEALKSIYYPPIAVVYTGFRTEHVRNSPGGFGFLVPAAEQRKILGSVFTSSVFEGRAPEGFQLFTTFIGGSRNADLVALPDAELVDTAVTELTELLGINGGPVFTAIKKWERSIPQYNTGYEIAPAAIDALTRAHPGIFVCSNFYRGISVGDCVKNAAETADAVADFLNSKTR